MVDNIQSDTGNAMPPPGEKSFIVLECKKVLNRNSRLVCIPRTWIKCVFRETKVAFAYPSEDEEIILRRIKNKEPDACWRLYFGEIKFETESFVDAVDYLQKIREDNNTQIEDKNNTIEPVIKPVASVKPKTPLKIRIDMSKLKLKLGTKKKSQKKHHKKHLKEKIHKSEYMKLLSLKKNITRSSQNSVDTEVGTESFISCQSNSQSAQTSPRNEKVIVHKPVCSVTQTLLKNNDKKRPSSKKALLKDFDRKGNNEDMLPEDRTLIQNMYIKIVKQVHYLETTALEIRRSHLVAIENQKVLEELAAKYRVQLPSATAAGRDVEQNSVQIAEEENIQDDAMKSQEDITEDEEDIEDNESASEYQPETEDETDGEQDSEENERATEENQIQDNHDEMTREAENTNKNYSASEENQFEEHEEEISIEDFVLPRIPEDDREDISKENNRETLRYQRPRPSKELFLVGKHSPFYINDVELGWAEKWCYNVKEFAYRLFGIVFSFKALRNCSIDGLNGRPALHYEARTFLKYYSLAYGRSRGWKSVQPEEIDDVIVTLLEDRRKGKRIFGFSEPLPLPERRRPKKYFY